MWRRSARPRLPYPDAQWPPARRGPRVLVEATDHTVSWPEILRDAGRDVAVCNGPPDARECPAVQGGSCPLVEGADVIVFSQHLEDTGRRAILEAHCRRHPEIPVLVEAAGDEPTLDGQNIRALRRPVTGLKLLEEVSRAMHPAGRSIVRLQPRSTAVLGSGGAPGKATGRVRHLDRSRPSGPRDVIVVESLRACDTPAVAGAGALVVETDDDPSGALIVARELGIPAVIGARGALAVLSEGRAVTVDGSLGVVHLLDDAAGRG